MGENCKDDKSSGYHGEFHRKNDPTPGFQSSIAELKDSLFIPNPNQGGAAKFKKISRAISNYVMQH